MDPEEANALLPELLGTLFPGQYRPARDEAIPADGPGGWVLEDEGALCLLRLSQTARPFIWIRVGAAIEIPTHSDLPVYVACANKDLVAGRAYLRYGEQFSLVAVDESIPIDAISQTFQPSIQAAVTRLDFALDHARDLQWSIVKRFGGRPFGSDEWFNLRPEFEGTALEKRPPPST